MDSKSLDEFAFDLQLDDEIRDQMSQYMQNNQDYKQNNNDSIDKLMQNNKEVSTSTYAMSTYTDLSSATNQNQIMNHKNQYHIDIERAESKILLKIDDICHQIIRDMNGLGVCCIDNLMEQIGEFILQEVTYLYETVKNQNLFILHFI